MVSICGLVRVERAQRTYALEKILHVPSMNCSRNFISSLENNFNEMEKKNHCPHCLRYTLVSYQFSPRRRILFHNLLLNFVWQQKNYSLMIYYCLIESLKIIKMIKNSLNANPISQFSLIRALFIYEEKNMLVWSSLIIVFSTSHTMIY